MLTMTQGTLWYISGMIGLTPWTQGSFFYFLDSCLLATSRNTGWMDFHEIFRILTQKAIGYTVSRLSRLLPALQTRRGGGLRSRSASCHACYANWLIAAFISCQKLLLPFFTQGIWQSYSRRAFGRQRYWDHRLLHTRVSEKIGLRRYVAVQILINTRLYCFHSWTHWFR